MADIIPFSQKQNKDLPSLMDSKSLYLHKMRSKLSNEKYIEFLESCIHPGIFRVADKDIQERVEGYFKK